MQKPVAETVDKRLGIELASLRLHLWRGKGEVFLDTRSLEGKPREPTDLVRWIDTTVMVVDCLTKAIRDDLLVNDVSNNQWESEQSDEAKRVKQRRRMQHGKQHLAFEGVAVHAVG